MAFGVGFRSAETEEKLAAEFLHREGKLRQDYLDRVAAITAVESRRRMRVGRDACKSNRDGEGRGLFRPLRRRVVSVI